MTPPFSAVPQRALRVVGIAFFGDHEMQRGDTERGEVAQQIAGGLRSGKSDHERDVIRRRRLGVPGEGQRQRLVADRDERAFAAGAVDDAGVERIAGAAAQDREKMDRAGIAAG